MLKMTMEINSSDRAGRQVDRLEGINQHRFGKHLLLHDTLTLLT